MPKDELYMEQHTLVGETIVFLKKKNRKKKKYNKIIQVRKPTLTPSFSLILYFLHPNSTTMWLEEKCIDISSVEVHHKLKFIHPSCPIVKCILNAPNAEFTKTITSVFKCIWKKVTRTNYI